MKNKKPVLTFETDDPDYEPGAKLIKGKLYKITKQDQKKKTMIKNKKTSTFFLKKEIKPSKSRRTC